MPLDISSRESGFDMGQNFSACTFRYMCFGCSVLLLGKEVHFFPVSRAFIFRRMSPALFRRSMSFLSAFASFKVCNCAKPDSHFNKSELVNAKLTLLPWLEQNSTGITQSRFEQVETGKVHRRKAKHEQPGSGIMSGSMFCLSVNLY